MSEACLGMAGAPSLAWLLHLGMAAAPGHAAATYLALSDPSTQWHSHAACNQGASMAQRQLLEWHTMP
jgi:hypothetical protein